MSVRVGRPTAAAYRPWFNYVVRRNVPRQRLVCLAGAGSGPSEFVAWRSAIPEHTELWPVQLPGREQRLREEPCSELTALVSELAGALKASEGPAQLPWIFFGHSFGALVMFELARWVAAEQPPRLRGLIVCGMSAPDRPARRSGIAHLSDSELLAFVQQLGGTPKDLLNDERFASWLLRDVRASYRIREQSLSCPPHALPCSISVFGGRDDFETCEQDLDAWSRYTSGRFRRHILGGGHFFLREDRTRFLELLAQELEAMAASDAQGP